jgi:broad specificity phosphatase PhoE
MSSTVLLIRHPESAWNRKGIYQGQTDIPLSPLGKVQAALVGARLSHESLSGIISSPLRRARSLARAIARHHHGLQVIPDNRLLEIAHGTWEGLHGHEIEHRFPAMYHQWIQRPHEVTFDGGESLQDVHDRSIPVIEDLLSRKAGETWVVVTHDIVARLAIAAAWGQPVMGFSSISLENAAITTLVGPQLIGSVHQVNDVAHLGEMRVNLGGQAL